MMLEKRDKPQNRAVTTNAAFCVFLPLSANKIQAFYFVPIHSALTATAASFAVAAAAAQWKTVVAAAAAVLGRMKARKNPQP